MGIEIPESLQWVAKYILGAGDWPEGDETAMRRLADGWTAMANALDTVDDAAATALNAALTALSAGETHDAITVYRDKLLSGDQAAFTAIRKWCEKQAEILEDGANDIEHTKLVIIGTMIVAAVEIGAAIATSWTGVGAAAGVAARVAAQVAVRVAIRQLITRMLTRGAAKALARMALKGAFFEALEEGGIDAAARVIQVAKGDRSMDDFGWYDLGLATSGGAVGGLVGGGLGGPLNELGDLATKPVSKFVTNAVTGTGTELAADLSAQVAATGLNSMVTGEEFKLDIGTDTFTSAGFGGIQNAAESGSHNSNNGPAPDVPDLGNLPNGTDTPTNPAGTSGDPGSSNPDSPDSPGQDTPSSPGDTGDPGSTTPASNTPSSEAPSNDTGTPSAPGDSRTQPAGAPSPNSSSDTNAPGDNATDSATPGERTPSSQNPGSSTPDSGAPSDSGPGQPSSPASNSSPGEPSAPSSPDDSSPSTPTAPAGTPSAPADSSSAPSTPGDAGPSTPSTPSAPAGPSATEAPTNADTSAPQSNPTNTDAPGSPGSPASPSQPTGTETPAAHNSPAPASPSDSSPSSPSGTTPSSPTNTTPSSPADTTPSSPADTTPSSPADTTPSSPADTTPSSPADTTPSSPADTTPSSPADTGPSTPSNPGTPASPASAPADDQSGQPTPTTPSTPNPSSLDLPPVDTPPATSADSGPADATPAGSNPTASDPAQPTPADSTATEPNPTTPSNPGTTTATPANDQSSTTSPGTTSTPTSPGTTSTPASPGTTSPGTTPPASTGTPSTPAGPPTVQQPADRQPQSTDTTTAAATPGSTLASPPAAATPAATSATPVTPAPPAGPVSGVVPPTAAPTAAAPSAPTAASPSTPNTAQPSPPPRTPAPQAPQGPPAQPIPRLADSTTPTTPPPPISSRPDVPTGNTSPTPATPTNPTANPSVPIDIPTPQNGTPNPTTPATQPNTPPSQRPATHPTTGSPLTPLDIDNANRARHARESLRPIAPAQTLRVTPPTGRPYLTANYPHALVQPVQVVRVTTAVTPSPNTPPATVRTVTESTQLATDLTFNQGNQFPTGDWLMVDIVPTTDPTTADLTIDAATNPTLTDIANTIRTHLGLPPRANPALTPTDVVRIGSDIDRANLARDTHPTWADQHTPSTPDTDVDPTPTVDTDTPIDLDAIHNQHAEHTPAGISHHRGDPTMGDLPHRVPPDPNHFTADTHITPDGMARIGNHTLTPQQYAELLRRSGWDGVTPIRLIGCDASTNGFAQQLAQELGVDVLAPTHAAWTDTNGNIFSSTPVTNPDGTRNPRIPPDGQWQTHHPNGTTTPTGPDANPPGTRTSGNIDSESSVDRARPVPPRSDSAERNPSPQQSADWNPPANPDGSPLPVVPRTIPVGHRVMDLSGTPQLEPNSAMVFTDSSGRLIGTFYTDDQRRITHADLVAVNSGHGRSASSIGTAAPDIARPEPGVTYRVIGPWLAAPGHPQVTAEHTYAGHQAAPQQPAQADTQADQPATQQPERVPTQRFHEFQGGPVAPAVDWNPPGDSDGMYHNAPPIRDYDPSPGADGPFSLTGPREPHTRYDVYDTEGHWHGTFYTDADGHFSHIQTWSGNQRHGFNPELGTGETWDAGLRVPAPNTTFAVGPRHLSALGLDPQQPRQMFRTDEHGDTIAASGLPSYSPPGTRAEDHFGPRRGLGGSTDLQTDVGNIAGGGRDRHGTYIPGEYDPSGHPNNPELYRFAGGHLIPFEAGGPGERINHVPQWAYENSGWRLDERPTSDSWRRMESDQAAIGRAAGTGIDRIDVFAERLTPDIVTPDLLHVRYVVTRPSAQNGTDEKVIDVRSFRNVP